jgi:hypothetical protein
VLLGVAALRLGWWILRRIQGMADFSSLGFGKGVGNL